jgi:ketosteroid isomerase-like protein
MTQDPVALLQTGFAAFDVDGVPDFNLFDPEIEVINFETFPVTEPYHGWDGVMQWLADISEPFDDFHFELLEVLAHDEDRVVAQLRVRGSSRTGGPDFALVWGAIMTYRDGKLIRAEGFRTPEEALAAAELQRP